MKQKSPSTAPLMNNPGGFDHSPTDDNDNENNPHQLAPKIEVIDPWGIDQLLDNDNNVEVKLALHLVKKCVLSFNEKNINKFCFHFIVCKKLANYHLCSKK